MTALQISASSWSQVLSDRRLIKKEDETGELMHEEEVTRVSVRFHVAKCLAYTMTERYLH